MRFRSGTLFRASFLICGIALAANAQTTDVSILKTGPATVTAGDAITYDITVSNVSATPAANVSWSDVLPPVAPGSSFNVQQTAGPTFTCTPGSGTVTCSVASLAAGRPRCSRSSFSRPVGRERLDHQQHRDSDLEHERLQPCQQQLDREHHG